MATHEWHGVRLCVRPRYVERMKITEQTRTLYAGYSLTSCLGLVPLCPSSVNVVRPSLRHGLIDCIVSGEIRRPLTTSLTDHKTFKRGPLALKW